jgi:hypothetical protein
MFCLVAATAVGVAASVANAGQPQRACSKYYSLIQVDPNVAVQVVTDKNTDGLVCQGVVSRDHPNFNYTDNSSNSQNFQG